MDILRSKYVVEETDLLVHINTETGSYFYDKITSIIDNKVIPVDQLLEYIDSIENGLPVRKLSEANKFDFKNIESTNIEIACERKNIHFYGCRSSQQKLNVRVVTRE